jgi:branched-subunit amino acid aminotransferase/4-amino-4-deoxychorismate lyase
MYDPPAFLNGRFVPASQLCIPVHDAGFVQGVTVAEQLRTFRGQLFCLEQHLERLAHSLEIVGVDPGITREQLAAAATRLAQEHHAHLSPEDDLGLSVFVTPGPYATFVPRGERRPTVGMHTYPLPFRLWAHKYAQGQSMVVSRFRQVPPDCWPAELKCRSRMHYYLADREAEQIESGARALILDHLGLVSEASTANVIAYFTGQGLVSPPRDKILPGISIGVLQQLAEELAIPFRFRDLTRQDLESADELLISSTSPCLLPVVRLDGRPIGAGRPGPLFARLLQAWSALVQVDIAGQATRLADR